MKYFVIVLTLLFFTLPKNALADSGIGKEINSEYAIDENGKTYVNNIIFLENKSSYLYPKSYIFHINNSRPVNIRVFEDGAPLQYESSYTDNNTILSIAFNNKTVGINKTKTILITYEDENIAKKFGDIWQVNIPNIMDINSFDNAKISFSVPQSFNDEVNINPAPEYSQKLNNSVKYFFSKNTINNFGISAIFGKFQIFNYEINYSLNPELIKDRYIAIPPDTSTQNVYVESIEPKPDYIRRDDDGNWLAYFSSNKNLLDVKVIGRVKVFTSAVNYIPAPDQNYLSDTLKSDKYWDTENSVIQGFASKFNTPEKIYNFVTDYLNYDFSNIIPSPQRSTITEIIDNPRKSLCTAYSDLTISLLRASGTPSREVQGWVMSDNAKTMPISQTRDVLHSWVEYWDYKRSQWIPIDPTWGSTNKSVNYFNNFDLKHIVFAIHGKNSIEPYPAGSSVYSTKSQKDVYINISQNNQEFKPYLNYTFKYSNSMNIFAKKLKIKVINEMGSAIYNPNIGIYQDNVRTKYYSPKYLLPFTDTEIIDDIKYGLFAYKLPTNISILYQGNSYSVPNNKTNIIFEQSIILFLLLILLLIIITKRFSIGVFFGFKNLSLK